MDNEKIVQLVSDSFGVSAVRMASKDRSKEITIAKIAYCGLVRDIQKATTINLIMGISTPSVRKYIALCDENRKKDKDFAKKYDSLWRIINNE